MKTLEYEKLTCLFKLKAKVCNFWFFLAETTNFKSFGRRSNRADLVAEFNLVGTKWSKTDVIYGYKSSQILPKFLKYVQIRSTVLNQPPFLARCSTFCTKGSIFENCITLNWLWNDCNDITFWYYCRVWLHHIARFWYYRRVNSVVMKCT